MSLNKRIIALRNQAGLTQAELAFECDWTKNRLSNYETGHRTPRHDDLVILAEALDRFLGSNTIVYLVTGSFIDELVAASRDAKKEPFTIGKATEVFEDVISDAIELGNLRVKPGFKLNGLKQNYSRRCGASSFASKKIAK